MSRKKIVVLMPVEIVVLANKMDEEIIGSVTMPKSEDCMHAYNCGLIYDTFESANSELEALAISKVQ